MKLVIASDIHGSAFWCRKLVEVIEEVQPDKILLLGDILYHGPRNDLPNALCVCVSEVKKGLPKAKLSEHVLTEKALKLVRDTAIVTYA